MMREIEELRMGLLGVNTDALKKWNSDEAAILKARAELNALLARSGPPGKPPEDYLSRLHTCLAEFRSDPLGAEFRTLRMVCSGAATNMRNDQPPLISDSTLFLQLLRRVDGYHNDQRRYRLLYAGLLNAYLLLDRAASWFLEPEAQTGNGALRAFLEHARLQFPSNGLRPDWVDALAFYPEVLSENPGPRFAHSLLTGHTTELEDACKRLGIQGTSWLSADVFRSAISEASSKSDGAFAAHLPALLTALDDDKFRALRDEALAQLLMRYSSMSSPIPHPMLRDSVIAAWKAPWLERNAAAWGRVTSTARQMVASWLKLEAIHQFFEVLSEDGRQDKSRFEFWRGYHDHMHDVYFALGREAYRSESADMTKLKKDVEGRLFELTGPDPKTNAFIMRIGDVVFVEFSNKGNAAYRYWTSDIQFQFDQKAVAVPYLKRQPPGVKLSHHAGWQSLFAQHLPGSGTAPIVGALVAKSTLDQLKWFARAQQISIEDNTANGGNLWLLTDDTHRAIAHKLAGLGGTYKRGRGWWWSSGQ